MELALDEKTVEGMMLPENLRPVEPTARVERLREVLFNTKIKLRIDHARIYTRIMRETEGEPTVTRRAKAFCAVAREMPLVIEPDELFVGRADATWADRQVCPEDGASIERAIDHYKGQGEPIINEEDEKELREDILPYWKGPKGNWIRIRRSQDYGNIPEKYQIPPIHRIAIAAAPDHGYFHWGHHTVNYEKVLKEGFLGIKKDAEERLADIDPTAPDKFAGAAFLRGVAIGMDAAAGLGRRYAALAEELAAREPDALRKEELLAIAEVCDWVPAHPARTFYEALQSYWFTHMLLWWEAMNASGYAVGRMDQYLYPYYERDIKEGRLTKEQAQELLDLWILRLNGPPRQNSDDPSRRSFTGSTHANGHLSVGGYRADGSDATNELSYMFLEAMAHTRLVEPNFSVQVHSRTPDDLIMKACQVLVVASPNPIFENCDCIIPGLLTRATGDQPTTLEDARGFASIGCQEPQTVGNDGLKQANFVCPAAALEFALNDGTSRLFPDQESGLKTGDPRRFESFEEVKEAYLKQFALMIKQHTLAGNMDEMKLAEMHPTVVQSALTEDCIEKGLSKEEGGARYNSGPGLLAVGLPDVADSLAAIKKVVFEDEKITMSQLCDALDSNFEGHEDIRQMLLKAPKYGNNIDYVDEQMAWAAHEWAVEMRKQKNTKGGQGVPGILALSTYVPYGNVTGALPSGRLAGEPLSDGASPCLGKDVSGPTAIINSLSKVNGVEQSLCNALNMRLDPAVFEDEAGYRRLAGFIRTLVDQNIQAIQFNVVSTETLRAAQRAPDKYQGLVVKIAGYNAFYTQLTKPLQDGIIARTEHRM